MNLLLLHPEQRSADGCARVTGRQLRHLHDVHGAQAGDHLKVGMRDGPMGEGRIETLTCDEATLSLTLNDAPPRPLPVTLVLALPRPKMLRRIIQSVVSMGVKRLVLVNSWRVEKSYWQTPWLQPEALNDQITLGLEQARDTVWPDVVQRNRFKPFVQDELAAMTAGSRRLIAHPGSTGACPQGLTTPLSLCIGPEGGFIPYEVALICEQGFEAVHLGTRILRTETLVPAVLGRLFEIADE
ncbi:16S rRNA (uracil(1498)-N(3))-methyltransferase [Salicola sp. Rm-C-2C1-2]|uniref:16S rRNA (uracil(1498)-N(3))-methyltransferase n=1 Tax=Salicola sp. Rm-C-2C1-2 TaxID=3141321 RepID=UPI0032E44B22